MVQSIALRSAAEALSIGAALLDQPVIDVPQHAPDRFVVEFASSKGVTSLNLALDIENNRHFRFLGNAPRPLPPIGFVECEFNAFGSLLVCERLHLRRQLLVVGEPYDKASASKLACFLLDELVIDSLDQARHGPG